MCVYGPTAHTTDAHRHYAPAALAAAVAAWRVGTDVYQAVQQAGYGADVAAGLASYISSRYFEADTQPDLAPISQTQEMSQVKRQRNIVTSTTTTAKVAPAVRKYVKKCMDRTLERKYEYVSISAAVPGTAGAFYDLGVKTITQGAGDDSRIGNQVKILRLRGHGLYYDSALASGNMRFIFFVDTQPNGANPAVADILAQATTYGVYNVNNVIGNGGSRFRILRDSWVDTTPPITGITHLRHLNLDLKPKVTVTYSANTGAITDVQKNNVSLLAVGFTATSTFSLNIVCEFVDE